MDLKKYKLDVLGVQETRLEEQEIDPGDHKLSSLTPGYRLQKRDKEELVLQ